MKNEGASEKQSDKKGRYKAFSWPPCEEALCVAESSRHLSHTGPGSSEASEGLWGEVVGWWGQLCSSQEGHPRTRPQHQTKQPGEEASAKPQCAFIYQSPTPHEEKITSRQSGFVQRGWHANPRICAADRSACMHDSTHTW